MTSAKRLLAIDLDGTLLDTNGVPHARDVRAVRAALAEGVSVSIVTGRLYSGSRAAAEVLGLEGAVGCADGSHVVRAVDHATLLHLGVGSDEATAVKTALARADAATFVFARDAIGHDASGDRFVRYVSTWSNDIRATRDVFEHELWSTDGGVTAVVALGEEARLTAAAKDLQRDFGASLTVITFPMTRGPHAGMWAVMVRASGGTKGTAVRWIAEQAGIPLKDTVAVGDWLNDLPMFAVAGRSFAMGQAPEAVKSKATDVLDETVNEGGGVATAIEKAFGVRAG